MAGLRSLPSRHDRQLLNVDACGLRGQEVDRLGDVVGSEPIDLVPGAFQPLLRACIGDVALHFGLDDARLDRGNPDVLCAELG